MDAERGIAASAVLGLVVAAALAIAGTNPAEFIVAVGVATAGGGYLVNLATAIVVHLERSRRAATQRKSRFQIAVADWLDSMIAMTADETNFEEKYKTLGNKWRTALENFVATAESLHEFSLSNSLSVLVTRLANAESFPIDQYNRSRFRERLGRLAAEAVREIESPPTTPTLRRELIATDPPVGSMGDV
ncbi:MAG TPA: hypothetical protein VGG05_14690 [Pseudonocardiaceae bacterium]|jgi:hypothetical protein